MSWVALTAASTAVLVWCERTGSGWRHVAKPLASAGFVGLALTRSVGAPYDVLVVTGAVFGMVGDVALLGRGRRWFLGGLVAFLLGHLAYLGAFTGALASADTLPAAAITAGIIVGGALGACSWRWLHAHLPDDMRLPVGAYVLVISLMVAAALAIVADRPTAAAGALLFAVSDLAVARQAFVRESFPNRAFGLPLYYGGQLLIVASIV